jgi:hypothetical protein
VLLSLAQMRQPDAATFDLAAVLHALGDPVRLELVRALAVVGLAQYAHPASAPARPVFYYL